MTDLKTEEVLRESMRQIAEMAPPAPSLPPVSQQRPEGIPMMALAAGFVMVVLTMGLVGVLLNPSSDAPGSEEAAVSATGAVSTPTSLAMPVTPAVPFTVGTFEETVIPEGVSGPRDFVTGAVKADFGSVVIGYHLERGPQVPLLWVASDSTWSRVDLDFAAEPGRELYLHEVVASDGGVFIHGVRYSDDPNDPDPQRMLMTSSDGMSWAVLNEPTTAELVELGFSLAVGPLSSEYRIEQAVWLESLLVARGFSADEGAAVFISSDTGVTWGQLESDVFARSDDGLRGLASNNGVLVAIGEQRNGGEEPEARLSPVFWRSVDGVNWVTVKLPGPTGAADEVPRQIATYGTGFVAFGNTTLGDVRRTVLWTSPNGEEWERFVLEELSDRIIHRMWIHDDTVTLFAATLEEPRSDSFGAFEMWAADISS